MLNKEQRDAIRSTFEKGISLIQGPPGTGKTILSAVYLILNLVLNKRILAVASTNSAVDTLLLKTLDMLKRIGPLVKSVGERFKPRLLLITDLDQLAKRILRFHSSKHRVPLELEQFSHKAKLDIIDKRSVEGNVKAGIHKYTQLMLKTHMAIFSTTNYAAHATMISSKLKLDLIYLDEGGQIVENELVPVAQHDVPQLVIIGDHKQHRTELKSKYAQQYGLHLSCLELFERNGANIVSLSQQYRMPSEICQLVLSVGEYRELKPMVSDQELLPKFDLPEPKFVPPNYGLRELFHENRIHFLHLDSSESSENKSSTNLGQSVCDSYYCLTSSVCYLKNHRLHAFRWLQP